MCRFLLFKGKEEGDSVLLEDLIVRPSHGIISQSFSSRERCAAQVAPSPALCRDSQP